MGIYEYKGFEIGISKKPKNAYHCESITSTPSKAPVGCNFYNIGVRKDGTRRYFETQIGKNTKEVLNQVKNNIDRL